MEIIVAVAREVARTKIHVVVNAAELPITSVGPLASP